MQIVHVSGGLGNQMHQYIFKRYLEIKTGKEHILCDLFYHTTAKKHNGFELDKIFSNIKLKKISDSMCNTSLSQFINKSNNNENILMLLIQFGYNIDVLIAENSILKNRPKYTDFENIQIVDNIDIFLKDNAIFKDNIFYLGYWQSFELFFNIKNEILEELEFTKILDTKNKYYYNLITQTQSISVHVRRGDFVNLGLDLKADSYLEAIKGIREDLISQIKNPVFYIFSNDLEWCHENRFEMGFNKYDEIVYVEGNMEDEKNYIDMQLMSYCKYFIYNSKSSFAELALWLNKNIVKSINVNK